MLGAWERLSTWLLGASSTSPGAASVRRGFAGPSSSPMLSPRRPTIAAKQPLRSGLNSAPALRAAVVLELPNGNLVMPFAIPPAASWSASPRLDNHILAGRSIHRPAYGAPRLLGSSARPSSTASAVGFLCLATSLAWCTLIAIGPLLLALSTCWLSWASPLLHDRLYFNSRCSSQFRALSAPKPLQMFVFLNLSAARCISIRSSASSSARAAAISASRSSR